MFKILLSCLIAIISSSVLAWQPSGPIRVIVGQGPGGGHEMAMRGVVPVLEKNNPGVTFVFENRPGMDSVIAMNYFAEQKPDGQTIFVTAPETSIINAPITYKSQLRTDPNKYVPVTMLGQGPLAFIVPIDSPINTVAELIKYLKSNPNKFNVGLSGGTNLLVYSYFVKKLKLENKKIQVVNYNSPTAAAVNVASKDLDMAVVNLGSVKSLVGTKIKILAHTANAPVQGLEEVPLMKQYVPRLVCNISWSVFLPPNTPSDVQAWYEEKLKQSLGSAEVKGYFYNNWSHPNTSATGSRALTNYIRELKTQWLPLANQVLIEK